MLYVVCVIVSSLKCVCVLYCDLWFDIIRLCLFVFVGVGACSGYMCLCVSCMT